jgi:hypothetical protein
VSAQEYVAECGRRGLLGDWVDGHRVRLVTHHGITTADVQAALQISQEVLSA